MKKIFLSYTKEDTEFAQILADGLKKRGFDTWFDQQEILWGDNLIEKTQESLKAASVVIVILSEKAQNSKWVAFEYGAATAQGKKIIPIILPPHSKEKLLPFLQNIRNQKIINAEKHSIKEIIDEIEYSLIKE